jgi:hypothetical protein
MDFIHDRHRIISSNCQMKNLWMKNGENRLPSWNVQWAVFTLRQCEHSQMAFSMKISFSDDLLGHSLGIWSNRPRAGNISSNRNGLHDCHNAKIRRKKIIIIYSCEEKYNVLFINHPSDFSYQKKNTFSSCYS